jgi:hypothetical protein
MEAHAVLCCFPPTLPPHRKLAGLGVPVLRTLFHQVFGQETASNNAAWLRRKLAEAPDSVHGQRRSPVVRARDSGAAIWNQDGLPEGEEDGQLLEGHMQEDADTDGHNQHNQQQHHQQAAGHDMQQRSSLQQGGSVFASAGLEGASTSDAGGLCATGWWPAAAGWTWWQHTP